MILFISGVLIAVIPFIVWLWANGALVDFWKDYYFTNVMYSSEANTVSNILKSFSSYVWASLSEVYFLLVIILIIRKKHIGFNATYAIYMFLNCLVISLSGHGFEHYGLVVVPTLVYPLSAFSSFIMKYLKTKSYYYDIVAFLSSIILIGFMIYNYLITIPALVSGNPVDERNERVVSVIVSNTESNDRILVLGFKDYYYVESDRLSASKFHFFCSEDDNYPDGLSVVIDDINNTYPKLVIDEQGFDCQYLKFDFSNYTLIDEDLNIWKLDEG